MRLFRERQRDGLRCLLLEVRNEEIESLVKRGLLKDVARNDKSAIKAAIYRFFDEAFVDEALG